MQNSRIAWKVSHEFGHFSLAVSLSYLCWTVTRFFSRLFRAFRVFFGFCHALFRTDSLDKLAILRDLTLSWLCFDSFLVNFSVHRLPFLRYCISVAQVSKEEPEPTREDLLCWVHAADSHLYYKLLFWPKSHQHGGKYTGEWSGNCQSEIYCLDNTADAVCWSFRNLIEYRKSVSCCHLLTLLHVSNMKIDNRFG